MSGGRVELGLGAGWYDGEHTAYGVPVPAARRALRAPGGAVRHHHRAVGHARRRDVRLRRAALPVEGQPGAAQAGPAARTRRSSSAAAAPSARPGSPPPTPTSSTCRSPRSPTPRPSTAGCAPPARTRGRDPVTLRLSAAQVVCCGADEAEVERRAADIGRKPDELRANGAAGTPDEVVARLAGVRRHRCRDRLPAGARPATTSSHIELLSEEVLPQVSLGGSCGPARDARSISDWPGRRPARPSGGARPRRTTMTTTSGAAAPAADVAGSAPRSTRRRSTRSSTRSPTTPPGWAKTDAAARADLLQQVIDGHHGRPGRLAGRRLRGQGARRRARPRRARSSSPASGRSSAWPACSATRCATSPRTASPSFAGPVREAPDGRLRVQVFPASAFDRITFPQTTAEVWMQPGVTRDDARRRPGRRLRRPRGPRRHGARARRRQRGLARPARRALQALRRGQGRRDEGQPGQRLPRAALAPRPGARCSRPACCASSTAAPTSGST